MFDADDHPGFTEHVLEHRRAKVNRSFGEVLAISLASMAIVAVLAVFLT